MEKKTADGKNSKKQNKKIDIKTTKECNQLREEYNQLREEYNQLREEYNQLTVAKEEVDANLMDANKKILKLENKNCLLNSDIMNLKKDIEDRDNQIDCLNKKVTEQKQITSIIEKDESQKVRETYQKIAEMLNYDYSSFKEAKDVEMSNELGEVFKNQLSNIFNVLNQVGINLE